MVLTHLLPSGGSKKKDQCMHLKVIFLRSWSIDIFLEPKLDCSLRHFIDDLACFDLGVLWYFYSNVFFVFSGADDDQAELLLLSYCLHLLHKHYFSVLYMCATDAVSEIFNCISYILIFVFNYMHQWFIHKVYLCHLRAVLALFNPYTHKDHVCHKPLGRWWNICVWMVIGNQFVWMM